jgi:acetyl-CoA carboxylase biotin carboxyl carrier protein
LADKKTVKAQMPGTFYRRPDPDSGPYVDEGESVSAGDTVGIIEVMKSFHEVKAEDDGTISKFLVENEEAVDAGQDIVELE